MDILPALNTNYPSEAMCAWEIRIVSSFFNILVQRHIALNALRVSLVVGALLNAINQGSALLQGQEIAWGQVLLNFLVPYCVASYSAAKNEFERSMNK